MEFSDVVRLEIGARPAAAPRLASVLSSFVTVFKGPYRATQDVGFSSAATRGRALNISINPGDFGITRDVVNVCLRGRTRHTARSLRCLLTLCTQRHSNVTVYHYARGSFILNRFASS